MWFDESPGDETPTALLASGRVQGIGLLRSLHHLAAWLRDALSIVELFHAYDMPPDLHELGGIG